MAFNNYFFEYGKKTQSRYVIDIGAQDGPGPVYPLFTQGMLDGLCIEGSPTNYEYLCRNLPQENVIKHCEFVTPQNIISIFTRFNVPKEPFVLKIDIDGYDYSVLDVLLNSYRPIMFIAEINEKIPPPICFETQYSSDYEWGRNHFYGFSLQSAYKLAKKHGYTVLQIVEGNNIICVRNDIGTDVTKISPIEMYKRDYLYNPQVLSGYPWNSDVHHWTKACEDTTEVDNVIADITDYFTTERIMRYQGLGKPVKRSDFFISSANF